MSPFEGSTLIYNRVILPYFLKHESAIDDALKKGSQGFSRFADSAIEKGDHSTCTSRVTSFTNATVLYFSQRHCR